MNVGQLKQRLMLSDPDTPFAIQVCFPSGAKDCPNDPCYFGSEDVPPETATFLFGADVYLESPLGSLGSLLDKEGTDDLVARSICWQTNGELAPLLEALLKRMG